MEKFNVVIHESGTVVAVSREPLTHGIGLSYRAYQVEAQDRAEAKVKAKARLAAGDKTDDNCWTRWAQGK